MSCNVYKLTDGCMDIGAGDFDVVLTEDAEDFGLLATAELLFRGQTISDLLVGSGITLDDHESVPLRKLTVTVDADSISKRYVNQVFELAIRPYDDPSKVFHKNISIVDNHANR